MEKKEEKRTEGDGCQTLKKKKREKGKEKRGPAGVLTIRHGHGPSFAKEVPSFEGRDVLKV